MNLQSLEIKNFKSILDETFEPGMVNVIIGANGSGKSALLEAIGVLGAAIGDRVDDGTLKHRGVRPSTPALFKSSFKDQERIPLNIELGTVWNNEKGNWRYSVNLNNPIDNPKPLWEYSSEHLDLNGNHIFGRSKATKYQFANLPEIEIDKFKGLFSVSTGIGIEGVKVADDLFKAFNEYCIYTPTTSVLRGIIPDQFQREPLGLQGGRLTEAVDELLNMEDEMFGNMEIDDLLELLDWVEKINIGKPTKDMLSPSVPSTQKVIRFTDRFMRNERNELTSYDASEGSLFVLFVLVLAMHSRVPRMFAVDNFDQAMNPRLARKTTKMFCEQVIQNNKIAFITTHNPLVLDGLDLRDERIRLFTIDRNDSGHTNINRVTVTDELLAQGQQGYSLSRLWVMGRLGGVPNL